MANMNFDRNLTGAQWTQAAKGLDPWNDLPWADFTAIRDEVAHHIMGYILNLPDELVHQREDELISLWFDLSDSARSRYTDAFREHCSDRVRELFNDWYWRTHTTA